MEQIDTLIVGSPKFNVIVDNTVEAFAEMGLEREKAEQLVVKSFELVHGVPKFGTPFEAP